MPKELGGSVGWGQKDDLLNITVQRIQIKADILERTLRRQLVPLVSQSRRPSLGAFLTK